MELSNLKASLREHIRVEATDYFGITNSRLIDQVTEDWFNDTRNYDGRWQIISQRLHPVGKVLDMAAGCGTFVLFGLHHHYDVWGVEPEDWKRDYFHQKVIASGYPTEFGDRILPGKGEALPFEANSFDLVTSYQTLEHVQSVEMCLQEMLRVLKPGGVLYLKCPDYNCWFEPHYHLPFLPQMNRTLASAYVTALGRPTLGLQTLQWTTEKGIVQILQNSPYQVRIEPMRRYYATLRREKLAQLLPQRVNHPAIATLANASYEFLKAVRGVLKTFREEANVDLWITKESPKSS